MKQRIRWTKKSDTLFVVEEPGFDRTWRVEYLDERFVLAGCEGWYWYWWHMQWHDEREGPYKTATAAKRAKVRYDGY